MDGSRSIDMRLARSPTIASSDGLPPPVSPSFRGYERLLRAPARAPRPLQNGRPRHRRGRHLPRTWQTYPHILPIAQLEQNILLGVRDAFWPYARAGDIKLHRDFHRLNSSQAFAFNLFFPFFRPEGDPRPLLPALELPSRPVAHWGFEAVLDAEEGSNFDVHWTYVGRGAVVRK